MGPTPSLVSQTYPIKETLRISERFNIKHKLGQGTFSFIYQAFDNFLQKDVALKVEKKDKNKSILSSSTTCSSLSRASSTCVMPTSSSRTASRT
jgi:serine/threonine protein kinase